MEALRAILLFVLIRLRIIRKPDFLARFVSHHPALESIEMGLIYVVGGKGYQKWACFRCPADADEIIQLSLMQNRRPRWQVTVDFLGRPTIHPSVWQQDGSYAHFWIRQGGIVWCPGSGQKPTYTAHH
jgi:hypothetical protein